MQKLAMRGSSYLELLVALILVFILIAVALRALIRFSEDAEKTEVIAVVEQLEKALTNLTAEQLVANDMAALAGWHGANPINLLALKPENYAGEFTNLENRPGNGNWYFDSNRKRLLYGMKHKAALRVAEGAKRQLEYQLKFSYADINANGRFDADTDEPQGLRLESLNSYEWAD